MADTVEKLDGQVEALREAEIRLITDITATLSELGDQFQGERKRLKDVSQDLTEMFYMIVVIGEFNAGKSTFVNAMLGDKLLPMGITPTTEMIELVRYAEEPNRKATIRDERIREWAHPNTGASGVAIVDTPGTGSVFQKHETTAKEFLHRSDLVLFVLSAKRAFAETERLYLQLAKEYGKKIILVVNQVDLLQPNEQVEVRRFIEQQAKELLDFQPLIFMVSAKKAMEAVSGNGAAASDASGLDALKAHLRGVFQEAPPAKQKLMSQLDTVERIIKQVIKAIDGDANLITADTAKVRSVEEELEQQALGLDTQLKSARADLDKVFEGVRRRGLEFIDKNLSLRRIGRPVDKDALRGQFQDEVIGTALRDVDEATSGYINAVVDQSRLYWRGVIDRLNELQDTLEQELTGLDASVYAEQRENLQKAIEIAEAELKTYSTGKIVNDLQGNFESNLNAFTLSTVFALGGIIAAIFATFGTAGPLVGAGAAAFALPVFAIALPVAAIGTGAALRYYRRVTAETRQDFNERLDRLQKTYHEALDDLTQKERNRLTQYGKQVLTPIFSRLEVLSRKYAEQQEKLKQHSDELDSLREQVKALS